MGSIVFNHVYKSYGSESDVLKDINLKINSGEFISILGPSGCGKTTLLKMINKLIPFDGGSIIVNGKDIANWDTIQLRRSIGYVIQHIGLLPHMTIEDNIGYVLKISGADIRFKSQRAKELITLVGMDESYLKRYPRELSGGQNQRVGVARALAADPDVILMDEPFGAVDELARTALQDELKALHLKLGKTILFVTHDIQEALKLGTRIVLMNDGCIEQVGTKEALVYKPETEFVKNFLGIKGYIASVEESILWEMYDKELKDINRS